MAILLLAVLAGLYLWGVRRAEAAPPTSGSGGRRAGRRWPRGRTAWFLLGVAALAVALLSPIHELGHVFLWVHMVQHLLIMMVAAPLLALGAPVTLALAAASPPTRARVLLPALRSRPAAILGHPLLSWSLFVAVLVGTHFSPLYELALERPAAHAIEHALYLGSALLFWWPVVGADPAPGRLSHPLRLVYVVGAGPPNTIVALAIYSAGEILYPAYARVERTWGPGPLDDQRLGAVLMWLVGDLLLLVAAILVLAAWLRHDRRLEARLDARLERSAGRTADRAPPPGR